MKKYCIDTEISGLRLKNEAKRCGYTYNDLVRYLGGAGIKVSNSGLKLAVSGKQPLYGSKDDSAYKVLSRLFGVRVSYLKGLTPIRTEYEFDSAIGDGASAFVDYLDSLEYDLISQGKGFLIKRRTDGMVTSISKDQLSNINVLMRKIVSIELDVGGWNDEINLTK